MRHASPKSFSALIQLILRSVPKKYTVLVVNISTARALFGAYAIGLAVRSESRVAFVHGSTLAREHGNAGAFRKYLIAKCLRSSHEVWVNNDQQMKYWQLAIPTASCRMVSPFSEAGTKLQDRIGDRPIGLLTSEYLANPSIYGVETVVRAWRELRKSHLSLTLTVVLYGGTAEQSELRASRLRENGVDVQVDLDQSEFSKLLSRTQTLVRATSEDGDSMTIREALMRGCRVIASSAVARPLGCELAEPSWDAIVKAYVQGGILADGSGLGMDPIVALRELADPV